MQANTAAACDQSMGECSMSKVSQSKPERAMTRVAYKSPSDSQVPNEGFPAFNVRLTGLVFMGEVGPLGGKGRKADCFAGGRQPLIVCAGLPCCNPLPCPSNYGRST